MTERDLICRRCRLFAASVVRFRAEVFGMTKEAYLKGCCHREIGGAEVGDCLVLRGCAPKGLIPW